MTIFKFDQGGLLKDDKVKSKMKLINSSKEPNLYFRTTDFFSIKDST